jgi:lysophospholipase L1-like esterase
MSTPWRRVALRLMAVLVGLAAGLGLAEVAVRIAFPADVAELRLPAVWFEPADIAGIPYLLRRNAPGWTNNLGLRSGHDVAARKPAGVCRLLVVGDSVTALSTDGTSPDQLFPALLEPLLAQRAGGRVEVLNLSSPGLSLEQELALLRARGLPLEPDLVLIAFARNDPVRTDIATAANVDPWGGLRALQLVQLWRNRHAAEGTHSEWYRPDSDTYRRLDATFAALARLAADHPLVVVPLPARSTAAAEQVHLAAVAELCRRHRLRCLDIYPGLLPHLSRLTPEQSRDALHFDAAGHRAIAAALSEQLGPLVTSPDAAR